MRTNGIDCVFASPIATMAPLWEALAARRERGEPETPTAHPIDVEQPDAAVMAEVDRVWNQLRHVPVGGPMTEEKATLQLSGGD